MKTFYRNNKELIDIILTAPAIGIGLLILFMLTTLGMKIAVEWLNFIKL